MMQNTATSYDDDTGPTTGTWIVSDGTTNTPTNIAYGDFYIECYDVPEIPVLYKECNDHPPRPKKLTYNHNVFTVVSHRIKQPYRMGFKRGNRL